MGYQPKAEMSLDSLHTMGTQLEAWLRMRAHPIAVKMLKSRDEIPADAIVPTRDWKHKYALCQSFARSQRDGLTIAMFLEDLWCFEPALGLGFVEAKPDFFEGHHRYPDSVRDLKNAATWCQHFPRLDHGQYIGIVSAPIGSCSFMPDVITMHVNGMQSSQLMIIKNWIDGKDVHAQLSGHAACVYAVVPVLKEGGCTVAIPCKGDRRLAFAQDDELLYSLVPDLLPAFVEGMNYLQEHNWGIPMSQEYKEEYDLKPSYAKMAELHGMKLERSAPRPLKYQKY